MNRLQRRGTFALAALAGVGTIVGLGARLAPAPPQAQASDHIDSPTVAQDRGSDLSDTFAFLDPNDNSQLVLMMATQGFIVSGEHFGMVIFDHNIRYRFEIENTGDAQPDRFVDVTYSPGVGRVTSQVATIRLPDGRSFQARTTPANQEYRAIPPVITRNAATGAMFYAGAADDPFFLDDTGANRTVASAIKNPGNPDKSLLGERGGRDTYAGFNTMITAVRVPVALLRGAAPAVGVNSLTQRRRYQIVLDNGQVTGQGDWKTIDRDGTPLVVNGLIPNERKNEYNGASTVDDANGRFRDSLVTSMRNFGTDNAHIDAILTSIQKNGDILRVGLNVPNRGAGGGDNADGGFANMGGRRLKDDVVDGVFTMLNNGVPLSDRVNGNELTFRNAFPFVADPHQPFPPGSGPDDRTRQ